MTTSVDFWFDPLCPWCWAASRWVLEASQVRPLAITWHPMSLGILNAPTEPNETVEQFSELARGPIRVLAAVNANESNERVAELYTALGTRFHHTDHGLLAPIRRPDGPGILEGMIIALPTSQPLIEDALAETGLAADYAKAFTDSSWDAVIRRSHDAVPAGAQRQELIGVPTISVEGSAALFGPVISHFPTGERAGALWDAFATLALEPTFFELKRVTDRPIPLD
ncbi:MAG TPA: hypothetical protein DCQ04_07775 [Actinobacteria bacterium]|nr:hypothetical protein [Actinomycetota bacterium]